MHREVSASMELDVTTPALIVVSVAVATPSPAVESLTVRSDGSAVDVRELAAPHGTRLHVLDAPTGTLTIDYAAAVEGRLDPPAADELDAVAYLRPSRYAPSDRLSATARAEFAGVDDRAELVTAVRSWVSDRLDYVVGTSGVGDDAVDTLLQREGVCRDYAHLTVGLLRALDVPARLAAVYAPGLSPMDFHAVAEAWVAGEWRVVDPTGLAPRASMLRIATGRDAADTAFLSIHGGAADLRSVSVLAVVDELPGPDDGVAPTALG